MNKKKSILRILLVFCLLLGGAYVLYSQLGKNYKPDLLNVQNKNDDQVLGPNTSNETDSSLASDTTEESKHDSSTEESQIIAPDFTVVDADGNEVQLSDFFGKPIVLNFWASWCGPCKTEMPHFNEAYLELGDDIHFLMINMTDGSRETLQIAQDYVTSKGYEFPVYYDTNSDAAITYSVHSLPTTYFIDSQGYAIAQAIGAIDGETLQKGIDMIYTKE